MKTITNIIYPAFASFVLTCFALSATAQGGDSNTKVGKDALKNNTTGTDDTALGYQAMRSNTTGSENTATGSQALLSNSTGGSNTANGAFALFSNTTVNGVAGTDNTATGFEALFSNTTGAGNTAVGSLALYSNTTAGHADNLADGSVAIGFAALSSNVTGERNTAVGAGAMNGGTTGSRNTATGRTALNLNTGDRNTADGVSALFYNTGSYNTATGEFALLNKTSGDFNIALGQSAGCSHTSGDNNIDIGNLGVDTDSNTIRIGTVVAEMNCAGVTQPAHTATYIAGISGQTASGGVAVYVNTDGKLGTLTSSARFKTEIKPMDESSEAILALKPVTFRYKQEIDPKGIPQFGLVAEDVEKVNPDLVSRDRDGKPYTVRYEAVNAMLLNEFLKAHRKLDEQEKTIAQLKSTIAQQMEAVTAHLKEQDSKIQKVSAQLELQKPPAQTVAHNQ